MGLFRSNCKSCGVNIDWFLNCEGGFTCLDCGEHNTEKEVRDSWNKNYAKMQKEINHRKNKPSSTDD